MIKTAAKIRFSATLFRPAATGKGVSWTFLTLPKQASAKLPSRGQATVEGTLNDLVFQATLEPDGQGGHWLKVDRKMREAAGPEPGDAVTLEIAPVPPQQTPHPHPIFSRPRGIKFPISRALSSRCMRPVHNLWIFCD